MDALSGFLDQLSADQLGALVSIIILDLVLAGDNAIVVGMVAAGLHPDQRQRIILWGIALATIMRIAFALVASRLLQIIGLTLAGGLLLAWVAVKLWLELRHRRQEDEAAAELRHKWTPEELAKTEPAASRKSPRQALFQIALADLSMSLDNALAVAGAARDHVWILVFGLALSVALMAVASTFIARLLARYHWIAYIGLAVIAYIAGYMIWAGSIQVVEAVEEQL